MILQKLLIAWGATSITESSAHCGESTYFLRNIFLRHAKRARIMQIATKSALQAIPKTCKEGQNHANSYKICFASHALTATNSALQVIPKTRKEDDNSYWSTTSAFQTIPKLCKEHENNANSDKIYLPRYSQNMLRRRVERK